MKRFRSKIYEIKNGEIVGVSEYIIEANSKEIAWDESIRLAFEASLFSTNIMVYIEEEISKKDDEDIYNLF